MKYRSRRSRRSTQKGVNPFVLLFWGAATAILVGDVPTALNGLDAQKAALVAMVHRIDLWIQAVWPW